MASIIDSVSAREWALLIWLSVFLLLCAVHPSIRGSLRSVVESFRQRQILVSLFVAALYSAGEIYLLASIGWWSIANLKTTILWAITFAFVSMFELALIKDRKTGLGKISREIVTVTTIFTFVTELHSFSLPVELAVLPIVTLIGLMAEMARHKPEHRKIALLLGCLGGLIALFYFGYSLWRSIVTLGATATWANGLEFLIPIILSVGFLPFLWGWQIYVVYSDVFTTLAIVGLEKKLVPYARWYAVTRVRGDLELLERWRQALLQSRPLTKRELKHSLVALRALRAREASPPVVPPSEGWSPYLAMTYMAGLGYDTGHYKCLSDGEWYASSPIRELGDGAIIPNNLAYYIEGNEVAATCLKFKLNVNDPVSARPAEDMFVVGCMQLLEQAVSLDAAERMAKRIAALEVFSEAIPFGEILLSRSDYVGGLAGGYSRLFEARRGVWSEP